MLALIFMAQDAIRLEMGMKVPASIPVIMAAVVVVIGLEPIRAETPNQLLQLSLATLRVPELDIAFRLHPEICSIGRNPNQQWSVACEGVPLHFYRQISLCDPGPPKQCGPPPSTYTDCRSFYWDIDERGNPTGWFGGHRFESVAADCMPKGTMTSDRADMARVGIAPVPEEILDYWGTYTGKPRLMK
ncbi:MULTISPECIES: hypothetical protein [Bradyrhizobium]|nr:hypothetical protein [Bradyrhizobium diazoefficiens]AWO88243.1 hypothetical protein DI395_06495 [Bradyrhizobium diazoefficiens]MBP1060176.1 hypothetical protein [Bradyrhizobium japonicum]WLA57468.1 hypothetical protein QIH81_01595 [Bradyrhizobium diazoefficiens]